MIHKGQLALVDSVENILQQGIEGYTVRVKTPAGLFEEQVVEKAALQSVIQQMTASQHMVEKIEPRRKDMEAFFLEIVAR